MKQFKRFGLVVVALLCTVAMAFAAKPNIHILATGGTIAGTGSHRNQLHSRTGCYRRIA